MLSACVLALFLGVIMQGTEHQTGDWTLSLMDLISPCSLGAEGVVADDSRPPAKPGRDVHGVGTILVVFCASFCRSAVTLTGALTIIINRLLTIIHSVGQLIAATIGTTILVTGRPATVNWHC